MSTALAPSRALRHASAPSFFHALDRLGAWRSDDPSITPGKATPTGPDQPAAAAMRPIAATTSPGVAVGGVGSL